MRAPTFKNLCSLADELPSLVHSLLAFYDLRCFGQLFLKEFGSFCGTLKILIKNCQSGSVGCLVDSESEMNSIFICYFTHVAGSEF